MDRAGDRRDQRARGRNDLEAQQRQASTNRKGSRKQIKPRVASKKPQAVDGPTKKVVTMTNMGKEPAVQDWGYMSTLTFIQMVALLVGIYNAGRRWIWEYDHDEGEICDSTIACATTTVTQVLISCSTFLGGTMFVSIACCILTKCYATRYYMHHSWLALIVSFEPSHDLHTYFGAFTVYAALVHSALHILRYVLEDSAGLIYRHVVNRSGIVALFFLLPTVLPMMYRRLKLLMTFEVRKAFHMLFLPFTIALCFHSPALRVVVSTLIVWYVVDRTYFTTRMTFLIERPTYKSVGRGTQVEMDLPSGYKFKVGAYAQINCPAISSSEWHPFSLFPVPGPGNRAGVHIEAIGDWSHELFRLGLESPKMPLWITAAQPSAMESSIYFENVLLVCTGAGITPAVSAVERYGERKNIHLLWMTREASMVALFETQLRRVKSTVHLTGKPNAKTKRAMMELFTNFTDEAVEGAGRDDLPNLELSDMETGTSPSDRSLEDDMQFGTEAGSDHGGDPYRRASENRPQGVSKHRRHGSSLQMARDSRAKKYHPVSVHFQRPDIPGYIADTVRNTPPPTPELSEVNLAEDHNLSRSGNMVQMLERLNSRQRLSKFSLMAADVELVNSASRKGPSARGSNNPSVGGGRDAGAQWLVLYCGANGAVEKALSSICDELKVTWRREYFSTW